MPDGMIQTRHGDGYRADHPEHTDPTDMMGEHSCCDVSEQGSKNNQTAYVDL